MSRQENVALVNGMGGIGKTALAQAYLSRYWDEYAHIAWLQQQSDNFPRDVIANSELFDNLSVDKSGDSTALFRGIMNSMRCLDAEPNLLLIDDAREGFERWLEFLPTHDQWHILLTSRNEIPGFEILALDFLPPPDAIALFKLHYNRTALSDQDIEQLLAKVDFHTLSIELLAKVAQDRRESLDTLMQALDRDLPAGVAVNHQQKKGKRVEHILSYLSNIFSTDSFTDAEYWLLVQFVCLPSEFHGFDFLVELIQVEESAYADQFPALLTDLKRRGWLIENVETDSYKMHQVIQAALLPQLAIHFDTVLALVEQVRKKLSIDQTKDNPVDKFQWIPFGKRLLEIFEQEYPSELSHLQNNLALVLQDLGDYEGAKALLEKALASDEQNFGEAHPTTAVSYSNLALVLKALGDYEGAKALLEKALASDEQNFGEAHPTTAVRYSNLALVLQDLGDYEGAKALLEKALASAKQNFGEAHPTTAVSYSNLALVLQALGDYEGAKALLEKALASDEQHFGEAHPTTAVSYSNLALVLKALGDYEGAKALLEKALASDEQNFGEAHPTTAVRYSNLALVLQDLGDYEGAKALLEKALASDEQHFGEAHPTTALRYWNLATVLNNLKSYEAALGLLEKAHGVFKQSLPGDHPYVKNTRDWCEHIKTKLEATSS